jgi:hypothetical protein
LEDDGGGIEDRGKSGEGAKRVIGRENNGL